MDDLDRCLTRLEAFDSDRHTRLLDQVIEATAAELALWQQTEADRYSDKGKEHHIGRIRAPELAARASAQQAAEAALANVREARAVLDSHTGLSSAELKAAETRRWMLQEDCQQLDGATLATRIRAAIQLEDRIALWAFLRYSGARLDQLQAQIEGDDPVKRAHARAALDVLRPPLQAAAAAFEKPVVAQLRAAIAQVDSAAQTLRVRAGQPARAEAIAAKRELLSYGI